MMSFAEQKLELMLEMMSIQDEIQFRRVRAAIHSVMEPNQKMTASNPVEIQPRRDGPLLIFDVPIKDVGFFRDPTAAIREDRMTDLFQAL